MHWLHVPRAILHWRSFQAFRKYIDCSSRRTIWLLTAQMCKTNSAGSTVVVLSGCSFVWVLVTMDMICSSVFKRAPRVFVATLLWHRRSPPLPVMIIYVFACCSWIAIPSFASGGQLYLHTQVSTRLASSIGFPSSFRSLYDISVKL